MPVCAALVASLACLASTGQRPQTSDEQLARAIRLVEAFDDEAATAALRTLLASHPPSVIASKAHLYLGILAFNGFHPDEARRQFLEALRANAAIELPRRSSPKIRLAFADARQSFATQVEAPTARPPPLASDVPPAQAPPPRAIDSAETPVESPVEIEQPATRSRSHVLSYILFGGAAVATGLAVFGGVEVLSDVNLVNRANDNPGLVQAASVSSAQSNAAPWAVGWIVCAAIAAAAGTAGIVAW